MRLKVGDKLICISKPNHQTRIKLKIGRIYTCLGVFPFGNRWQIAIDERQVRELDGFFSHRFIPFTELNKALI